MDNWKKFNETPLPEENDFGSNHNMEDITDVDYAHKREFVRFWNKKFRRIAWFVFSRQYIIVSSCIWELSKYVS